VIVAGKRYLALILWGSMCLTGCQPLERAAVPPFRALRPSPTKPVAASTITAVPAPTRTPTPEPVPPQDTPDALATPTQDAAALAWQARSGAGSSTWGTEDEQPLQNLARAEGAVLLYSDTPRASNAAESFAEAYPGLNSEAYALSGLDIYLRLQEDLQRGQPLADVYLVSDGPRSLPLFAARRLWSYLPTAITSTLGEAPSGQVTSSPPAPPVTHHWSAVVVVFNSSLAKSPPVGNWWALTLPEWRGRVVLPDPLDHERTLYLLATLTQHAEELAQAYRAESGRELTLDADCPNAGYQWIKDLLRNEPVLVPGDAEVARRVGALQAQKLELGLCGMEQLARVRRGDIALAPLAGLAPAAGLRWRTYLGIVDRAPHPNAAKLLVRWLLGDAQGGQGYAPWYEPGYYPARSDVADPPGSLPRQELEPRLWELDAAYLADHLQAVRELVAAYLGRPLGGR